MGMLSLLLITILAVGEFGFTKERRVAFDVINNSVEFGLVSNSASINLNNVRNWIKVRHYN